MFGEAGGLLFPLLMIAVFYLFFIRPQMSKQKEVKKLQESLKKGSRVVTSSGIHGKVVELLEANDTVKIDLGKTTVVMDRSAIVSLEE